MEHHWPPGELRSSSLLASGEAAQGAGSCGLTAPRSRGTAGSVPVSWGLRTLRAQSPKAGFLHFQSGDLGFRDFLESSFLFGKWNGQGCQCRFRARGPESTASEAKGQACALRCGAQTTGHSDDRQPPDPGTLRKAPARADSKMRTSPDRTARAAAGQWEAGTG